MAQRECRLRGTVWRKFALVLAVLSATGLSGTTYYEHQGTICGGEIQTLQRQVNDNYFELLRVDDALNTILPAAVSSGSFTSDTFTMNVHPDASAYIHNAADLQTKTLDDIQIMQNQIDNEQTTQMLRYFLYPSIVMSVLAAIAGNMP
jgi:hypothetical protein